VKNITIAYQSTSGERINNKHLFIFVLSLFTMHCNPLVEGKFTHKGQAVLFSSDLKDEPARGSKYCQNKKYRVFLVNFGQPVYKKTKTFKFLMEV
jgi:hypothetical protein